MCGTSNYRQKTIKVSSCKGYLFPMPLLYVLVGTPNAVLGIYTSMVDAVQQGKRVSPGSWTVFRGAPNTDGAFEMQRAKGAL